MGRCSFHATPRRVSSPDWDPFLRGVLVPTSIPGTPGTTPGPPPGPPKDAHLAWLRQARTRTRPRTRPHRGLRCKSSGSDRVGSGRVGTRESPPPIARLRLLAPQSFTQPPRWLPVCGTRPPARLARSVRSVRSVRAGREPVASVCLRVRPSGIYLGVSVHAGRRRSARHGPDRAGQGRAGQRHGSGRGWAGGGAEAPCNPNPALAPPSPGGAPNAATQRPAWARGGTAEEGTREI